MNIPPAPDGLEGDKRFGPIAVEAAIEYAAGRPRTACPFSVELPAARRDWNAGWDEAASIFPPTWLERERRRWKDRRAA